ncbi:hypothetical protein LINPERHAP2_LOCUS32851 [Linum perenne]
MSRLVEVDQSYPLEQKKTLFVQRTDRSKSDGLWRADRRTVESRSTDGGEQTGVRATDGRQQIDGRHRAEKKQGFRGGFCGWFFPHCTGHHFIVFCVNLRDKVFQALDSVRRDELAEPYVKLGEKVKEPASVIVPKYQKGVSAEEIQGYERTVAHGIEQKDNESCGVLVCNYLEFLCGNVLHWMIESWADQVELRRAHITVRMLMSSMNDMRLRLLQAASAYVFKGDVFSLVSEGN